jgi:23S rRNA (uracil1939-C5)-methyltransferase
MEVSESVDASQRAVHVEASHPLDARIVARMPAPSGVTGLTVTVRDVRGAAVESVVFGSPFVEDVVRVRDGEIRLRRHVMSFFQGNRFLLPALVDEVIAHVRHGDRVLDLYAGTGLFSIAAAALRGAVATAVEGGRTSAADLRANASAVGAGVVTTVHLPVEAFVGQSSERFDVAVVDPPRTGISREALQGVMRLRPGTVVYVSCDVATLARDVRRLVDGGYRLVRLVGFDLFPNTPHVEAVGVLTIG